MDRRGGARADAMMHTHMLDLARRVLATVRLRSLDFLLATWMAYQALVRLLSGPIGTDGHIYYRATAAFVHAQDPWLAGPAGTRFNGPPITLVPLVPFTLVPEQYAVWLWTVISAIAAWWAIQRLGLAWYWVLFPPLVDGINGANPNVAVFALLVGAAAPGGAVAAYLKVYAILPLILLRRWRDLAVLFAMVVFTAPLLPWGLFVEHLNDIARGLATQTSGGYSASSVPVLILPTALGLILLGRERAAWLIIPALWPDAGYHYGVFALGAAHPILGVLMSLPNQGAWPIAVVTLAIWFSLIDLRSARLERARSGYVPTG